MRRLEVVKVFLAFGAVALSGAAPGQGAPGQGAPGPVTGEVREKIDASSYSYLRVAAPGGDLWAAVPTASVRVGQKVTVQVQTVMPNFESKTLSRTFERLAFGTLVGEAGAQAAPVAAAAPGALPPGHPPTGAAGNKPLPGAELLTPRKSQAQKVAPPAPAAVAETALEGEVLETLEVPSYTYLRLKTAAGEEWAAVPTAAVKPGARVRIANPMVMQNFESKILKRHFVRIVFGTLGG